MDDSKSSYVKNHPFELDGDGTDFENYQEKKHKVHHEENESEIIDKPISKAQKTIMDNTAWWIKAHPACFSERFVFFYTAHRGRGYNRQNVFLAQATLGAGFICRDGFSYKSSYDFYYQKRAIIVERFDLERLHQMPDDYKAEGVEAKDLRALFKEGNICARDIKALVYDFAWTDEARADWDYVAPRVLYEGNFYKFTRHPKFYQQLMDTGDKYIIKSCPEDCPCTCGIQFSFLDAMENRKLWQRSLLGKTLMRLRDDLKVVPSPLDEQYPTQQQLDRVASIEWIDDGRDHQCEICCPASGSDLSACGVSDDGSDKE